jgi:hypothetical protein
MPELRRKPRLQLTVSNDAFREQAPACSFFIVRARRETKLFQETDGFEFFPQNLLTVRNLQDKVVCSL